MPMTRPAITVRFIIGLFAVGLAVASCTIRLLDPAPCELKETGSEPDTDDTDDTHKDYAYWWIELQMGATGGSSVETWVGETLLLPELRVHLVTERWLESAEDSEHCEISFSFSGRWSPGRWNVEDLALLDGSTCDLDLWSVETLLAPATSV